MYSFSKLNAWHQCKWGWHHYYVDHAPQVQNFFAECGTAIHHLIEQYLKGEIKLEDMAPLMDWEWDTYFTMKAPKLGKTDLNKSYHDKCLHFLETWDGFPQYKVLGVEEHFVIPIGDFEFQGYIDAIFEDEDGEIIVCDWKSHNKFTPEELVSYGRQPYLYASYVKEKFGKWPKLLRFYAFREMKAYDIPFNIEDAKAAVQWAIDTVAEIRSAWQYPKSPDTFYCLRLCGNREECEYGKYWRHKKGAENS